MPADGTTWYKMFAVTSIFSGLFSTTAENPAFGESQVGFALPIAIYRYDMEYNEVQYNVQLSFTAFV